MLKKQPSNAGKVDEILKKQIDDKIQRVDKILEQLKNIWKAKEKIETPPAKKIITLQTQN